MKNNKISDAIYINDKSINARYFSETELELMTNFGNFIKLVYKGCEEGLDKEECCKLIDLCQAASKFRNKSWQIKLGLLAKINKDDLYSCNTWKDFLIIEEYKYAGEAKMKVFQF